MWRLACGVWRISSFLRLPRNRTLGTGRCRQPTQPSHSARALPLSAAPRCRVSEPTAIVFSSTVVPGLVARGDTGCEEDDDTGSSMSLRADDIAGSGATRTGEAKSSGQSSGESRPPSGKALSYFLTSLRSDCSCE